MRRTRYSRPARLGASLLDVCEHRVEHLFLTKSILVRLEPGYAHSLDAQETFRFAVNQCLRFCPKVYVDIPSDSASVTSSYYRLGEALYEGFTGLVLPLAQATKVDAIISVGSEVRNDLPWIAINSDGWIARIATSSSGVSSLPKLQARPNCIGALAAACLGAEAAFYTLLLKPKVLALELSLCTHETGLLGLFNPGPDLPLSPLRLDAFLVGCGSVANGWAYAVSRLPLKGTLEAIDNQSVRDENLGSYVAAFSSDVGHPKVNVLQRTLTTNFLTEPRAEAWELFKIRLKYGLAVPNVVVAGLDNIDTRHSVQSLWPKILIDLGAGGLTSQVIIKQKESAGACLLHTLQPPATEIPWVQQIATQTGLPLARIMKANTPITEEDVAKAPSSLREKLATGRATGQLLCGVITQHELLMETENPNFTPAVPFVTAFSGIVGAASTIQWLMAPQSIQFSLFQRSFESDRSATHQLICPLSCECQRQQKQKQAEATAIPPQ